MTSANPTFELYQNIQTRIQYISTQTFAVHNLDDEKAAQQILEILSIVGEMVDPWDILKRENHLVADTHEEAIRRKRQKETLDGTPTLQTFWDIEKVFVKYGEKDFFREAFKTRSEKAMSFLQQIETLLTS